MRNNVEGYSVYDVYNKPSIRKVNAENYILDEMRELNGFDYHIISYNTCFFTCGYYYRDKNNKLHFVYHTHTRREDTIIEE